jgi:hypothetical protein
VQIRIQADLGQDTGSRSSVRIAGRLSEDNGTAVRNIGLSEVKRCSVKSLCSEHSPQLWDAGNAESAGQAARTGREGRLSGPKSYSGLPLTLAAHSAPRFSDLSLAQDDDQFQVQQRTQRIVVPGKLLMNQLDDLILGIKVNGDVAVTATPRLNSRNPVRYVASTAYCDPSS